MIAVGKGGLPPRLSGAPPDGGEGAAAVIREAYIQGVSTRSVDDLVKAMGMSGISKSQVSRLCEARPRDQGRAGQRLPDASHRRTARPLKR
ncbi:hypothetical protein N825_33565 [Skermanella stibiiresistens SB22]|uniref:Mutator family transposase n=1 Tax=Skermanella stibiiresistens SB22 TaxID=1385369 RepID=W9H7X0_9PROT|nr:hypothetical protein N825_33565 [Skermanella stibiiresistens SB22]